MRIEGTARHSPDESPAHQQPAYLAKYSERIAANFDTPERFAELFSAPLVIIPTRLHV